MQDKNETPVVSLDNLCKVIEQQMLHLANSKTDLSLLYDAITQEIRTKTALFAFTNFDKSPNKNPDRIEKGEFLQYHYFKTPCGNECMKVLNKYF